jgi:hypothetical protein
MNPYLEQNDTWEDFHHDFITRTREVLSGRVGPNYLVKIEVRLYLHELSAEERRYFDRADVGVATAPVATPPAVVATLAAAPVQLTLPAVDVERHASLEIRDRRNRRLITVMELLSPTNKTRGQTVTNTWPSGPRSWPGRRTSLKSTWAVAANGRDLPIYPRATTTCW